jgi:DNA-binding transcriptional LysR family regulator
LGLGQIEQFMKDLSQLRRGHVTLACMPLLSLTVMPDIVAAFTRERPEVSISLQTRSSSRIVEWVSARQVDFGVGIHTSRTVDVTVEPVVDLELFCALPPGHELEHRTELGPSDLTDRDIITLSNHDRTQIALDALLDQHKIAPRRRIEVFWTSVALELALRGAGIAFVDRMTAERVPDGLSRLRRFRPRLTLDLCLFWPLHWQSSALARLLADQIRAEIQRRAQQEV